MSVFEPFMGSGTTLVAATRLNRKTIGVEMSREYVDKALKRLNEPVSEPTLSQIEPPQKARRTSVVAPLFVE